MIPDSWLTVLFWSVAQVRSHSGIIPPTAEEKYCFFTQGLPKMCCLTHSSYDTESDFIWHILNPVDHLQTKYRTRTLDTTGRHKAGDTVYVCRQIWPHQMLLHIRIPRGDSVSVWVCVCVSCFCCILLHHNSRFMLSCVPVCHSANFAATVGSLPSWPPPGPLELWPGIRGFSLPLCLTHNHKLAQTANVRPKTLQRELRPTKVMLRVLGGHCHLCPTWMHSHTNVARRKPIWPPVWLEIQKGQLVRAGNAALPREWRWGESLQGLHFGWGWFYSQLLQGSNKLYRKQIYYLRDNNEKHFVSESPEPFNFSLVYWQLKFPISGSQWSKVTLPCWG